jgi:hypothetical protein
MIVAGEARLPAEVGRGMPARLGIIPFMPSLRSQPQGIYLLRGEFPPDILRQSMRLSDIGKDITPATVETAQFTAWQNAFFAFQPIQLTGSRCIQGSIDVFNEFLLRGNGDMGSEFLRPRSELAILNQIYPSPFFLQDLQAGTEQQIRPG